MRKLLFITALITILIHATAATTISSEPVTVKPGQTTTFNLTITTVNTTQTLNKTTTLSAPFDTEINTTLPLTINNTNKNITATADIPEGFRPGTYNARYLLEFLNTTKRHTTTFTVEAVASPSIGNVSFPSNISVGTENNTGHITLSNTGNIRVDYDVDVEGNLSKYLLYDNLVQLYPGIEKKFVFEYDVPPNTDFGSYNATIYFNTSSSHETFNVSVETLFLDNIPPRVNKVSLSERVMATRDAELVVHTTDNIGVQTVSVDVLRTVQQNKTVGNDTFLVDVNKTVESIILEQVEGKQWSANLPTKSITQYYVNGVVEDASGNTATFNTKYRVEKLDALKVESNIQAPNFQVEKGSTIPVGVLEQDTPVEVTLESFDQPLKSTANESWDVGIQLPEGGRAQFSGIGDSIRLSSAGNIAVFLSSDTAEAYSGTISWKPIDQHVPVEDTEFYGEFKNFTQPEDQEFTIIGVKHDCDAFYGENLSTTGWKCEYFLSSGTVPPSSTLEESMTTVVPKQYREEVQEEDRKEDAEYEQTIDNKNGERNAALVAAVVFLLLFFGDKRWNKNQLHMFQYPDGSDMEVEQK